mgnify:CR=1 FL=1
MLGAHVEYLDYKILYRDTSFFQISSRKKLYWLTPTFSDFVVTFYLLTESMGFDPTKRTDIEDMTSGDYAVWRTSKQNEVRF